MTTLEALQAIRLGARHRKYSDPDNALELARYLSGEIKPEHLSIARRRMLDWQLTYYGVRVIDVSFSDDEMRTINGKL